MPSNISQYAVIYPQQITELVPHIIIALVKLLDMANLSITILLAFICVLAVGQNSDAAATIFAQTFNLPIIPSSLPSIQNQAYSNRFPTNQGSIYRASQATVNRQTALNEIRNSAQKQKLPIKTVKSQQSKTLYIILREGNGEIFRFSINKPNLIERLFGLNPQFLQVPSKLLNLIPQDGDLDEHAQLIKAKDDGSLYLAKDGARFRISPNKITDFGFAQERAIELEPCFMQLFALADQLN